ncbi:hypothetical protein FEM48_Zijuj05G0164300 [Ziziphus jujuba var. spinosa]|uniref:KIB1-4 beta-propeller domain-containing protein n=1 Tax=Ziziphus jujuba var. spinosa TaxID=714518 RepID=A0A978VFV8_ZIZJJ|nr:hypothetical protein FEM48_Zijuj05G0164300 [Ziziphus jujuba var. spinosa]
MALCTKVSFRVKVLDCYIDICSPEVLIIFTNNFDYQYLWCHFVKGSLVDDCLYESFEEEARYFQFATAITSNDIDEIQKFLDAAVDARWLSTEVTSLSPKATEKDVYDFFTYCGAIEHVEIIRVWKLGDEKWAKVDDGYGDSSFYQDIAFYNGRFYAVDYRGLSMAVDPLSLKVTQATLSMFKSNGFSYNYLGT